MSEPTFSGPDICAAEAHEVVGLLKTGEVSPTELLTAAFARIEAVEPAVNAMPITCRARAEAAADGIDPGAASTGPGWLAGLPIAIKDLNDVKGVRSTYGNVGLADNIPKASDPLVERLEGNGGVVVGKTNVPEFGAGGNTFNEVFGRTRNPWDTRMNAGGSSGGAAVSLATGEVWLSHGSDHGGSLRTPAGFCGIVGLRPTPGRAGGASPAAGFGIEGAEGPMARSVRDVALFLDAMAGYEPRHPTSYPAPNTPFQDAVIAADGKIRIAFAPDLNGLSPVEPLMAAHLAQAMVQVERNGAVVEEACPDLAGLEGAYHTLRGLGMVTSSRAMPESITRHFKKTLRENTECGRALTVDEIADAHIVRTRLYHTMRNFLGDFDVLACPVVGNFARVAEEEYPTEIAGHPLDNYMDWLRFAFLATTTGLPAMSVPVGRNGDGMPVGIQLIGPPRGEAVLLAAGRAVEMAMGGAMTPIDPLLRHV